MFLKVLSIFIFLFSITLLAEENTFYQTLSGNDLLEVHFKKEIMLKSKSIEHFRINIDKESTSYCSLKANSEKEEIYVSAGSKWKVEQAYLNSPSRDYSDITVSYKLTNKIGKLIDLYCDLNLSDKRDILPRLHYKERRNYDELTASTRELECSRIGGVPKIDYRQDGKRSVDCYKIVSPISVEIFKEKFKTVGIGLVFKETEKKEIWTTDSVKKSSPAKTKSNN